MLMSATQAGLVSFRNRIYCNMTVVNTIEYNGDLVKGSF